MSALAALLLYALRLASDLAWALRRRRTLRRAHERHDAYRRAVREALAAEGRGEAADWPKYPGSWL